MPRVYTKTANKGAKKPRKCQKCHEPIVAGDRFYQWCPRATRSGSGYNRYQHVKCGSPRQSQLYPYNKMSPVHDAIADAQDLIDEIETPSTFDDCDGFVEAVKEAMTSAAETAREVGEEYRESASNIESGFGNRTYQCDELEEKADALDSFADEIESWDPSADAPTEDDIDGLAEAEDDDAKEEFEGQINEAIEAWCDEVRDEAGQALDELEV